MLLGGGIGIAGVGSAFASVINALKDNTVIFKISMFLVGIILVIAIPIIISAIMKLRRRNIGMFLEACGWSINTSMRLNLKMGLLFTRIPAFPENSEKKFFDYSRLLLKKTDIQKKSWQFKLLIIVIFIFGSIGLGYAINRIFNIDEKLNKALELQVPVYEDCQ
jgi:type III secretory pathway component EscS